VTKKVNQPVKTGEDR